MDFVLVPEVNIAQNGSRSKHFQLSWMSSADLATDSLSAYPCVRIYPYIMYTRRL